MEVGVRSRDLVDPVLAGEHRRREVVEDVPGGLAGFPDHVPQHVQVPGAG